MTEKLAAVDKFLLPIQKLAAEKKIEAYLVGGFLRDFFLDRPTRDFDFACPENPKRFAEIVARAFKGTLFILKEEREIFRVTVPSESIQFDFAKFKDTSIDDDLSQRDFSINAIALPLDGISPSAKILEDCILDPFNGRDDIKRKIVRQISEKNYADDPLRLLRAFRIATQLQFEIDDETFATIQTNREKIKSTAAERIREEILLILDCPHAYGTVKKMDAAGLISILFPEVDPNRECAIHYYPGKGVWGHSLDGLENLEWILENLSLEFPEDHEKISGALSENVGGTHPRSSIMKMGILFHDVGKAKTAEMIEGRMRFFQHEDVGAQMTKLIVRRLKFSSDETHAVSRLVQSHMRPGGLAHIPVLTEKAKYRFFRDLGDSAIPMLLVALADRYTYLTAEERGAKKDLHEQVTKELIRWHYEKEAEQIPKKTKLIDGNILMEKLKLEPGPLIGEILKELEEKVFLGEIKTQDEAITFTQTWLKSHKLGILE